MFHSHKCYVIDTKPAYIKNDMRLHKVFNRLNKGAINNHSINEIYENLLGEKPKIERRFFMDEFQLPLKKNLFGLYLVKVELNGHMKQFLLDTGAQISACNDQTIKDCSLTKTKGSMQIESFAGSAKLLGGVLVDTFRIGGLEIRNQPMVVSAFSDLNISLLGKSLTGIDGILGWDILSTLDFEIDDLNRTFNLIKVNEKIGNCNLIQSLFPTLILLDKNHDYALVGFDSGAKTSWINSKLIGDSVNHVDEGEAFVLGVHGLESVHLSIGDQVRFKLFQANIHFENIMTGRTNVFKNFEFDAILGNELLRKRKIRFINSQCFVQII